MVDIGIKLLVNLEKNQFRNINYINSHKTKFI